MRSLLIGSLVALLTVFLAASTTLGDHENDPGFGSKCSYVRKEPPGPRGNVMRVRSFEDFATLRRDGREIYLVDQYHRIDCRGGAPSVINIDRIQIRGAGRVEIDQTDGSLAPGASPEEGRDEIEIQSRGRSHLFVGEPGERT